MKHTQTFRRGAYIVHRDAVVARLTKDIAVHGDSYHIPIRGPLDLYKPSSDVSHMQMTCTMRVSLYHPLFDVQGLQVLPCEIPDGKDVTEVLRLCGSIFALSDSDLGDDPSGIVTALKIVMNLPELKPYQHSQIPYDLLHYLLEKYTSISKRPTK